MPLKIQQSKNVDCCLINHQRHIIPFASFSILFPIWEDVGKWRGWGWWRRAEVFRKLRQVNKDSEIPSIDLLVRFRHFHH